jgi:hypothetical protein
MGLAQVATDPKSPMSLIAVKLMNGLYTIMNDMLTEFEVGKKDALNPQLMQEIQVVQQIQAQMQQLMQQVNQLANQNQQLQVANAQLQGQGIQQPGMAGPAMPPPGVQGPMPMGGPQAGPSGGPVA